MRSRAIAVFAAAPAVLLAVFVLYARSVSTPLFDESRGPFVPRVANPDEALTFARTKNALLLVTAQDARRVRGRDLTAALGAPRSSDLIALYRDLGFDGLRAIDAPEIEVPLEALEMPIDYTGPRISPVRSGVRDSRPARPAGAASRRATSS